MDRPYEIGDTFVSQEWDPVKNAYTGKEASYIITYVLNGEEAEQFGLKPGYGILTLKEKEIY